MILLKWNERRKEEFKLKCCFQKDRIKYDTPYEETEFSTLELKKRSEALSRRDDRYNQRWKFSVLRENNKDIQSQGESTFGTTKRGAFVLSKYSKFMEEGLKSNQEIPSKARK